MPSAHATLRIALPWETDILAADALRPRRALSPEQRLMLAVLEDAIACVGQPKWASQPGVRGRRTAREEARAWMASEAFDWPFSFVAICEALGFDPSAFRARCLGTAAPPRPPGARAHANRPNQLVRLPESAPREKNMSGLGVIG